MIRRPALAHYLEPDTRVGFVTRAGKIHRGRVRRVYKGKENPYELRLDNRSVVRCSLDRLVPESEAPESPPRKKKERPSKSEFDISPTFAKALKKARAAGSLEQEKTETLLEISSILGVSTGYDTPERLVQRLSSVVRKLQTFERASRQEIR